MVEPRHIKSTMILCMVAQEFYTKSRKVHSIIECKGRLLEHVHKGVGDDIPDIYWISHMHDVCDCISSLNSEDTPYKPSQL
jgi:hypothetical protein